MKIAWASNAPWAPTGYGQQTAQMLPRLRSANHDVAVITNYGLAGGTIEWDGFRCYPQGREWSNDVIPAHAIHHFNGDPGWLIALYDAWTLTSPYFSELNMATWCPVDHLPAPPLVAKHFADTGSLPIAMSRFGQTQLEAYGLKPWYAPHGIDTNVFVPHDKAEAKAFLGVPQDRFLVGMVSTNNSAQPCRKSYPEAFAAFAMFAQDHPNALLYVHAEKVGLAGGMELDICAQGRGIRPDQLAFVDQYRYRSGAISPAELAWIYSAFDVMLFPSMGEGFGIPAVEAQACGTPIIVSDFSAQSELVAPGAGYLVASQPYWDSAQAADFCVPSIADLTAALEHAYGHPDQLRTAAETCRTFAEGYDADQVFEQHWVPILEHMESEMPSVAPISL